MSTFTVCFCGTDCWTDEGFTDRSSSGGAYPALFGQVGYIPVKIYSELTGLCRAVIPGPGGPYADFIPELKLPSTVLVNALLDTGLGSSMWDLAGHAVASIVGCPITGRAPNIASLAQNKALMAQIRGLREQIGVDLSPTAVTKPPSNDRYQFNTGWYDMARDIASARLESGPINKINLIGHSRGAVGAIMCSHELGYLFPNAEVNIFAIDPVPGAFKKLAPEMMTLGPTVKNYVAVYAVDEISNGFNGVIPWPHLNGNQLDPLAPVSQASQQINVPNYHLIYAPGRHATVAGNMSPLGDASLDNLNPGPSLVGKMVNFLARACLRRWGTSIDAATDDLKALKDGIKDHAADYRNMRSRTYDMTGPVLFNEKERGITCSDSINPSEWVYLEDAIGIQPLVQRKGNTNGSPGQIRWQAIQDIPDWVFEGTDTRVDSNYFVPPVSTGSSSGSSSS